MKYLKLVLMMRAFIKIYYNYNENHHNNNGDF